MAWQGIRARTSWRRARAATHRWSLLIAVSIGAMIVHAAPLVADEGSPQFNRGACEGTYPGWLRGMVDGYHDLAGNSVDDPRIVIEKVPMPEWITSEDEDLGYQVGLMAGYTLGIAYGVELGKGAREAEYHSEKMVQLTEAFQNHVQEYCGDLTAAVDWNATFMNHAKTSTVTSLNEAQIAMHFAVSANQMAISAENMVSYAREAQAKGDLSAVQAFRDAALLHARTAADFARLAEGQAAGGREEAVQPIMDAQSAAERAKKAADSIDG